MWIVMTSSAAMPQSCMGRYGNVALVKLTSGYAATGTLPKMISDRARGVERLEHLGHHHMGKTARCAFARTLAYAEKEAARRNREGVV